MFRRIRRTVLVGVLFGLVGCVSVKPCHSCILHKPKATLRFATYNVYWQNSSKDKRNPDSIVSVINEIAPDILVLQETFCFSEQKLERHFTKSYPYRLFRHYHSKTGLNEDGLGIMSKYPIVKNTYFPPVYGWFPAWLFVLKTPKGYVQVLNVHLHPRLASDNNIGLFGEGLWLTPYFRLQEITSYYPCLNPKLPTIIAGDFNENDYGAAGKYLQKHCFQDLLLSISSCIKTWHTQFGPFTFTGRYDRIYTTQTIHPRNCQILQKGQSDHFPVIMDFIAVPNNIR